MVLPLWSSVRARQRSLSALQASPWRLACLRVAASTHRARWQKGFYNSSTQGCCMPWLRRHFYATWSLTDLAIDTVGRWVDQHYWDTLHARRTLESILTWR